MRKFILPMVMVFVIVIGCEKQNKEPEPAPPIPETEKEPSVPEEPEVPRMPASICEVLGFLEGVSALVTNPEGFEESYLIKGVVLDKIEYSISVKLIEDLKGNFDKNDDVFKVWGDGVSFVESNRMEKLSLEYDKGDTLIMHIDQSYYDWSHAIPTGHVWLEKPEDYNTVECAFSVVKLSDGYATGRILLEPEPELVGKLFIEKLPIDEFENKLNKLLKK
ncbi:MAG: hypothetical protein LBV47_07570 [Bacteroidales bacterium]|jgi:hypothetical protein|nr:hypothetical protein [Bacteroidales bacterium]